MSVHAELDFDPKDVTRHKEAKQRGVSDKSLAASLRKELASLLSKPLHQRLSRRFVTGGMSQEVAAAICAHATASGVKGGMPEHGVCWEGAAGAMQKSVQAAEEVVAAQAVAHKDKQLRVERAVESGSAGQKKRKSASLVQCQAQALHRALDDKRRRKAGRGFAHRQPACALTLRQSAGADALDALRVL
jgi:hypothetical protein